MRLLRAGFGIVLVVLLGGCADDREAKREAVDLILHNGVVFTFDAGNRRGTAIAVRDGLIVAGGDERPRNFGTFREKRCSKGL